MGNKTDDWVPMYIRGNEGFKDAVVAKLEMMWLRGNTDGELSLLMFWLPKKSGLRSLKKAIGSKLIFKFRMHFITDLDIHIGRVNKRSDNFSDFENDLIVSARKAQVIIQNRETEFDQLKYLRHAPKIQIV